MPDKPTLRAAMKARLAAMTTAERAAASSEICRELAHALSSARVVLAFHPMASEPDVLPWAAELLCRGVVVGLPRVDWTTGEMRGHVVKDFVELVAARGGLREPRAEAPMLPAPDLVLVPGLAFCAVGLRLGRGGGHYDRFLASLPSTTRTCGVAFESQVVEQIPRDPWDVAMKALVTERGLRRFGV
ncbi:MAG: 5-formyltetrahydrofolate cyclo-ligase [Phycisphaerales bacterium]